MIVTICSIYLIGAIASLFPCIHWHEDFLEGTLAVCEKLHPRDPMRNLDPITLHTIFVGMLCATWPITVVALACLLAFGAEEDADGD